MPGKVNQKLKILFLTKWFPNRYDPQVGVFVRKHASAVARFCDVALLHVFSDDHLSGKKYEFVVSNEHDILSVIVYFKKYTKAFGIFNRMMNFMMYCRASSKGLKYIRKNFGDHDISHAYILLRTGAIAYLLKLFRGKPYVITEAWSGYATGKFEKKNWLKKFLTYYVVKKSNAVTVVSEFLKKSMLANGIKKDYFIVHNIVEPVNGKVPERSDGKIKILVVADLVDEIKNVSGILKAIAEIIPSAKNIEMNIIGEGTDRKKLESLATELKLINEYVFFHGVKSNEKVYQQLMNCDFIIMNSNFETFSMICAEAISCGKPVIATRCGGPQEFVTAETGILIEPGSHEQLVNALHQMIREYKNYPEDELRNYARSNFSYEVIAEKFLKVYQSALKG